MPSEPLKRVRRPIPTQEEILEYFKHEYFEKYNNWGRWGKEDQMGTLNYITAQKRAAAARLVSDGGIVSCERQIVPEMSADVLQPPLHFMQSTGERWAAGPHVEGQMEGSGDWIGFPVHGLTMTHLDALGHHFYHGKTYNGFSSARINAWEKATVASIEQAAGGIATRGVLLDAARFLDVKYMERGEPIYYEDLVEMEKAFKVKVEPGDVLLVRTGACRRRAEEGPKNEIREGRAGLHGNTIPFIHERGVAVLCGDAANDVIAPHHEPMRLPIHHLGIAGLGLWLIDNADLEALGEACAQRNRWEFLIAICPLRFKNATGSPVNPIAVF